MLRYFETAHELLARIAETQAAAMGAAAGLVADCIARDGVWHIFGTGHSHAAAEEMYFRAGGLAPVQAILVPALMQHEAPISSTRLERLPGYAAALFDRFDLRPGEVLTVISNSGRNAVPIEFAREAKARGLATIALCSFAHAQAAGTGALLKDICDVAIDNCGQPGDAALPLHRGIAVCATSTLANTAILQQLVFEVCNRLIERGIEPPVFRSANMPGGDEWNAGLIARYRVRCGLR